MWLLFAFLSAFGASSRNVLSKLNIGTSGEYMTMWSTVVFALLFGLPFVLINGFEISDPSFWRIVAIRVVLDTAAFVTYIKALKYKSVNYVIPLVALTPALVTISSFFINGQRISSLGLIGVIIIVISTLTLFLVELDFSNLRQNRELFISTAMILTTVMIWGVLDSIHAEGIERSSPYTYFFIGNVIFTIIFSIALIISKNRFTLFESKQTFTANAFLGIFLGVEFLSQLMALSTGGLTAYVSSIKSLNITLSPVLAIIFLKEKVAKHLIIPKTLATLGAFGGVVMIIFG